MHGIRQTFHLTRLLWDQERSDLRLAIFNGLLLPLTLVYYGTRLHAEDHEQLVRFMAGAATMSIAMTAMSQVGISMVTDRFSGRLTTLVYVARSRGAYFLARNVLTILQGTIVALGAVLLFAWMGIATASASTLCLALAVGVLGSLSIGGLGALIVARARSAEGGEAAIGLSAIVLSLASPVFYSVSGASLPVKAIAALSPLTHVAVVFDALLRAAPIPLGAVAGMFVSALAVTALAFRSFEWR